MDRIHDLAAATVLLIATLLIGQAAAENLLGGDAGQESQMSSYITVQPDPLVEGQPGKVCYDFAGSGATGTISLDITWTLIGGGTSTETVKVTAAEPCADVTPPANCTGVNIVDTSGASTDYGGSVSPPPAPPN